jgi:hypothetical protein
VAAASTPRVRGGIGTRGSVRGGRCVSHREAPLIADDPVADADTYAFLSPDKPDTITLWGPGCPEPAGGRTSHFGDDVRYDFDVDNNGDNVPTSSTGSIQTTVGTGDVPLQHRPDRFVDSKNLNVKQTYTVTLVKDGKSVVRRRPRCSGEHQSWSTPNHALAAEAVKPLGDGSQVFAGPRADPFFVDLGSVFDFSACGEQSRSRSRSSRVDDLQGYNVHWSCSRCQTQLSSVTRSSVDRDHRRKERRRTNGTSRTRVAGRVSRSAAARWPSLSGRRIGPKPTGDVLPFVQTPNRLGSSPLYRKGKVPPTPRNDLVSIFVTGIESVNMPKNVKGGEMIRLNTSIPSTATGTQDRLGLLAGQMDGFPNGRRLVDDVTDIELRALAGGTPFTADFNISPNNALTDGVDKNDVPFLRHSRTGVAPPGYSTLPQLRSTNASNS